MTTPRTVTGAPDVTCPDHWHCDPTLAPHACDRPNRTKPCPTCDEAPRPVTGPDGDNPITDEQIARLRARHRNAPPLWLREYAIALGEQRTVNDPDGDAKRARARCAAAYNARVGTSGEDAAR